MTALFLSPHNDDETLFGAFTIMAQPTHVVVVLRSRVQERYGISAETREAETAAAMEILGCTWEQWTYRDDDPPWSDIAARLVGLNGRYDTVYAPAREADGHEHHNRIATLARLAVPSGAPVHYTTYTRHGGKSSGNVPVVPALGHHTTLKLRALACYRSQIEIPEAGCEAHFLRDLYEWRTA